MPLEYLREKRREKEHEIQYDRQLLQQQQKALAMQMEILRNMYKNRLATYLDRLYSMEVDIRRAERLRDYDGYFQLKKDYDGLYGYIDGKIKMYKNRAENIYTTPGVEAKATCLGLG